MEELIKRVSFLEEQLQDVSEKYINLYSVHLDVQKKIEAHNELSDQEWQRLIKNRETDKEEERLWREGVIERDESWKRYIIEHQAEDQKRLKEILEQNKENTRQTERIADALNCMMKYQRDGE